jgi:hypothetical protein
MLIPIRRRRRRRQAGAVLVAEEEVEMVGVNKLVPGVGALVPKLN